MKKETYILIIFIVLIITFSLLTLTKSSSNKKDINPYKEFSFYKEANLERYKKYYENNNYSYHDVVLRVNMNLDYSFYTHTKEVDSFNLLMLVNKYNGLDKDFIPSDLVSVDKEYAIDSKQKANREMYEAFIKMSDDCKKETGYKVIFRSGYRDYKSQEDTYNLFLKTYGKKYAEVYAAHAGFSEHQTGLAVDIKAESSNTFAGTKESNWLSKNAYKYGFILRYKKETEDITGYKYESWHYRYVGSIAEKVYESKMTYDEYYIRFLDK